MDILTVERTLDYLETNNYLRNKRVNRKQLVGEIKSYFLNSKELKKSSNLVETHNLEIHNRRYLGSKTKLIDFIKDIVTKECGTYNSFMDLFGGTGIVGHSFNSYNTKIIVNDLLYSNYLSYKTWLDNDEYDIKKITHIISELNSKDVYEDNYVSKNFGNKFFTLKNAMKIGWIREQIESLYKNKEVNERERAILITSLLYALDKVANTCGHYDAYRKTLDLTQKLVLCVPIIDDKINHNNEIYRLDSNELVKKISADIVYIDPPYNSRQYADAYHLLENIAKWEKPEVIGVAKKMVDRADIKSKYCTVAAPVMFKDLIENINAKYILVSYNNMGEKGAGRSQAKITDKEILDILEKKGKVKIFEQDFKYFSAGKTDIEGHKERVFLCEITPEKAEKIVEIKNDKINFIKSPLNYTGGKHKLLNQLKPYFPSDINTFYDIFSGGANVGINAFGDKVICVDKQEILIRLFNFFKTITFYDLENEIEKLIKYYKLSNTLEKGYIYYNADSSKGVGGYNKIGFSKLREDINNNVFKTEESYLIAFYTLIVFSFNNQFRFNKNNHINIPVGKRDFNNSIRKNLKLFVEKLHQMDISFINTDFRNIDLDKISNKDFLYLDPPYLITKASYNENGQWTDEDEKDLLVFLKKANKKGIRFALSNVLTQGARENSILFNWVKENNFNLVYLNFHYNNSNYQKKNKTEETEEVLITNY